MRERNKALTGWELKPTYEYEWGYGGRRRMSGWRWVRLYECPLVCCKESKGIHRAYGPAILDRHEP